MTDISDFINHLRALDAQASSATDSLQNLRSTYVRLAAHKAQLTDPKEIALMEQKMKLVRENMKAMGESSTAIEKIQRETEQLVRSNKGFLKTLEAIHPAFKRLTTAVTGATSAFQAFQSGSLGQTVVGLGQVASIIPLVGWEFQKLSSYVGIAIDVYVKFQDKVQLTNKTIIDANAAVGRFALGMKLATTEGDKLRHSIAGYSQFVGISTEETSRAINTLSDLGFSMQEMGFDEQTHQIRTVTDSIREQTDSWGALAASIAIARVTGVDQSKVASQMHFQVKSLGDSVRDVASAFSELSSSAARSALSTSILMPILRGTQEAFKFLGLDSSAAARALGDAGKAAKAAGLGSQAAVELMGRAIDSMAAMEFGTMAFLGQQMGMGGGLAAGFQFRQRIGQEPGAIAQDIGKLAGQLMGGTGEIVSEEQARSNDYLASIRLGQEMLISQFTGMNQREARAYLNLVEEMSIAKAQGKDTRQMAEKLRMMEGGEAAYRQKTLTMQQKMTQFLEVLSALVGRLVVTFVRAFAGGAAGDADELGSLLGKAFKGIEEGRGIDQLFGKEGGFHKRLDQSFKGIEPTIEKLGKGFGTLVGVFFDYWDKIILAYIGGKVATRIGGKVLSRAMLGGGATIAETAIGAAGTAAGAATRGGGAIVRLLARLSGPSSNVVRAFTGLGPTSAALLVVFGKLAAIVGTAVAAYEAAAWVLKKVGLSDVMEKTTGKIVSAFLGAETAVKGHNKAMLRAKAELEDLSMKTGLKTAAEAEDELRTKGGTMGVASLYGVEQALSTLQMAQVESEKRLSIYRREYAEKRQIDPAAAKRARSSIMREQRLLGEYAEEESLLRDVGKLDLAGQQQILGEILGSVSMRASRPEEVSQNTTIIREVLSKHGVLDQQGRLQHNVIVTLKGGDALTKEIIKEAEYSVESGKVAPGPSSKSGSNVGRSTGYRKAN